MNTEKSPPEPSASDFSDELRCVHESLAAKQQQDPVTKQFVPGAIAAGKTLERSVQFWSAVEPLKRELVERVRRDAAVDESSIETLLGTIDSYCEARLFRSSLFLRIVDQGGAITMKGSVRALYRAYLATLDREMKLAQTLGLERRAKHIAQTPSEALMREPELS